MKFKVLLLIVLSTMFISLLTGCGVSGKGINDRAIISCVGVDIDGGEYIVTMRMLSYNEKSSGQDKSQGQANSESSNKEPEVLSVKSDNLTDIFAQFTVLLKKTPYLSHMDYIVLGSTFSSSDMMKLLDFLNRSHDIRNSVPIFLSSTKAESIIRSSGTNLNSTDLIERIKASGANSELVYETTLVDVTKYYIEGRGDLTIPILEVSSVDQTLSTVNSAGVLQKGKLSYVADSRTVRAGLFLRNEIDSTDFVIDTEKLGTTVLNLIDNKTQIASQYKNNELLFSVKITGKLIIKETAKKTNFELSPNDYDIVIKRYNETLEKEIRECITKCLYEKRSDIFGLSEKLYNMSPKLYKQFSGEDPNPLYSAAFNFTFNTEIVGDGKIRYK